MPKKQQPPEVLLKLLRCQTPAEKATVILGKRNDTVLNLDRYCNTVIHQAPLSFIDECDDVGCLHHRIDDDSSDIRSGCEREIIKVALTIADQKNEAINYLNFGAGNCFQDLLVITNLLEKGIKKINFHAIDTAYESYIDIAQKQLSGKPITAFHKDPLLFKHKAHIIFSELAHWFKNVYPDATCRIFIHKHIDDYISFTTIEPSLIADIVAGIDFTRDCPAAIYMWTDFLSLLEYIFAKNNGAIGFKDYLGCGVLKLSPQPLLCDGFEEVISLKEKQKLFGTPGFKEDFAHAGPWDQILLHHAFYTTGKIIQFLPIEDRSLKGQIAVRINGSCH